MTDAQYFNKSIIRMRKYYIENLAPLSNDTINREILSALTHMQYIIQQREEELGNPIDGLIKDVESKYRG